MAPVDAQAGQQPPTLPCPPQKLAPYWQGPHQGSDSATFQGICETTTASTRPRRGWRSKPLFDEFLLSGNAYIEREKRLQQLTKLVLYVFVSQRR